MSPVCRCFAIVMSLLAGLSAAAGNIPWSLGVWQSEDGLPNNNVVSITQTPDGYLWLAMPSGMARFDGHHFEDFPTGSFATNYENQRLRAVIQTRDGGLAVGIEPGHLLFLNHGALTILTNGLPSGTIEGMTEDGDGALWVSYHGGALCRIQHGAVTRIGSAENFPAGAASCAVTSDRNGHVWISKATETGILRDGRFRSQLVLGTGAVRMAPARDGGIWAISAFSLYKLHEGQPPTPCGHLNDNVT